jgi:hypothetical protein
MSAVYFCGSFLRCISAVYFYRSFLPFIFDQESAPKSPSRRCCCHKLTPFKVSEKFANNQRIINSIFPWWMRHDEKPAIMPQISGPCAATLSRLLAQQQRRLALASGKARTDGRTE